MMSFMEHSRENSRNEGLICGYQRGGRRKRSGCGLKQQWESSIGTLTAQASHSIHKPTQVIDYTKLIKQTPETGGVCYSIYGVYGCQFVVTFLLHCICYFSAAHLAWG